MITYTEQREKIVQAYLKCELDPFDNCACFVGNLLNNKSQWRDAVLEYGEASEFKDYATVDQMDISIGNIAIMLESKGMYTAEDIADLEYEFLEIIDENTFRQSVGYQGIGRKKTLLHPNYENALFEAMEITLESLRKIHARKGDLTAIEIPLEKRVIVA